jgi:hypothetical protein
MGYRTFVSMKIALIGTGSFAESYARRFLHAGHIVFIAWLESDATGISQELTEYDNLHICTIEEAALVGDLIIIATAPKDVREVAYWLGDVRRKVIIDATSNIHTGIDGKVRTVCAIKSITGAAHIVKVFSTKGYEKLLKPLFGQEHVQLIMVGESKKAKEITKILSINLGVERFFDMGGSDAIPLFNEMTSVWRKLAEEQYNTIPQTSIVRI